MYLCYSNIYVIIAGSGICGIAVISAIFAAKDIEEATKELKEKTIKMLEKGE